MVVGGSQQETLNPDFVLRGTRQQAVPVILRGLVLPDGFDPTFSWQIPNKQDNITQYFKIATTDCLKPKPIHCNIVLRLL
ncbi:unnamed protein product [Schistosoma curassoni]|uniref:Integrin_alpha2 domain-containing protein n=1 Tax=Schistosoma curassoni TaxID=6186 RepID=A0A183KV66_9TREM|nr:unnamed protein product [Schistosoma curassoni]